MILGRGPIILLVAVDKLLLVIDNLTAVTLGKSMHCDAWVVHMVRRLLLRLLERSLLRLFICIRIVQKRSQSRIIMVHAELGRTIIVMITFIPIATFTKVLIFDRIRHLLYSCRLPLFIFVMILLLILLKLVKSFRNLNQSERLFATKCEKTARLRYHAGTDIIVHTWQLCLIGRRIRLGSKYRWFIKGFNLLDTPLLGYEMNYIMRCLGWAFGKPLAWVSRGFLAG